MVIQDLAKTGDDLNSRWPSCPCMIKTFDFESLKAPRWCRYPKTVIVNNMFLTDFTVDIKLPAGTIKVVHSFTMPVLAIYLNGNGTCLREAIQDHLVLLFLI